MDTARVEILDDRHLQSEARVLDVSQSGIRLAMAVAISKGIQVRLSFRRPAVIHGEIRYCRRAGELFEIGVEIHDVAISPNRHLDADELALYISGKGLTEVEFFYVRVHIAECAACANRVRDREELGTERPQPL